MRSDSLREDGTAEEAPSLAKPYNLLANGCDLGDRHRFPVGGDIARQLDVRTGVRCERRKALILDVVNLVTAYENIFAAGLDAAHCAFLRVLAHIPHTCVALAAHAVADLTCQGLGGGPNR